MYPIEEYIHGRCQIFALALGRTLNYRITIMWDAQLEDQPQDWNEFDEPTEYGANLVHAYCTRDDGTYVDASGTISRQAAETDHGDCWEPDHREIQVSELNNLMAEGIVEAPAANELEELSRFIKANLDVYRDGSMHFDEGGEKVEFQVL
jgi:hypothetical protein